MVSLYHFFFFFNHRGDQYFCYSNNIEVYIATHTQGAFTMHFYYGTSFSPPRASKMTDTLRDVSITFCLQFAYTKSSSVLRQMGLRKIRENKSNILKILLAYTYVIIIYERVMFVHIEWTSQDERETRRPTYSPFYLFAPFGAADRSPSEANRVRATQTQNEEALRLEREQCSRLSLLILYSCPPKGDSRTYNICSLSALYSLKLYVKGNFNQNIYIIFNKFYN